MVSFLIIKIFKLCFYFQFEFVNFIIEICYLIFVNLKLNMILVHFKVIFFEILTIH